MCSCRCIAIENADEFAFSTAAMPVSGGSADASVSRKAFHPHLYPQTPKCLVCGELLQEPFVISFGANNIVHTHGHGPVSCTIYSRTCGTRGCGTVHHYSHYVHGGVVKLSDGALELPYFLLHGTGGGSGMHFYETSFLDTHRRHAAHGHMSFTATVAAYNEEHAGTGVCMGTQDFTDNFMALQFIRYMSTMQLIGAMNLEPLVSRQSRREKMDELIVDYLPAIRASFSRYWGLHAMRLKTANPPLFRAQFGGAGDPAGLLEFVQTEGGMNDFLHRLMPHVASPPDWLQKGIGSSGGERGGNLTQHEQQPPPWGG